MPNFAVEKLLFNAMQKDTIVFYQEWWEALQELPDEQRGAAMAAIMDYAFSGTVVADPMLRFATAQMRSCIDRDAKRYNDICRKRRESVQKRWAKEKNPPTPATDEYTCKHPDTPDYHNEYEDDHENEHVHEQNKDKSLCAAAAADAAGAALKEKVAQLKGRRVWVGDVGRKFKLSPEEVIRRLEEFCDDMVLRGRHVACPQSLFVTWLSDRLSSVSQSPGGGENNETVNRQNSTHYARNQQSSDPNGRNHSRIGAPCRGKIEPGYGLIED